MELVASIPCGKAKVNIPFTGGSQSAFGVTPATFTTEDPFKQALIQNSDMYKSGKIYIVSEANGTGKYKEFKPKAVEAPEGNTDGNKTDSETIVNGGSVESKAEGKVMKEVEVADIDIARDYLVENFGINKTAVRYKANVLSFAEEHNIAFVTPEGPLC